MSSRGQQQRAQAKDQAKDDGHASYGSKRRRITRDDDRRKPATISASIFKPVEDVDLGVTRLGPSRSEVDQRWSEMAAKKSADDRPARRLRDITLRLSARSMLAGGESSFDAELLENLPEAVICDLAAEISRLWPSKDSLPFKLWRHLATTSPRLISTTRLRVFRRLCLSDESELLSLATVRHSTPILIDLTGLAFTDDELARLHTLIGPTCEALRLDRTDVSARGLGSVAMACCGERSPFSKLKILSLRGLRSVGDQSVQRLVNVLPALAVLDLRDTACSQIGVLLARDSSGFAMAESAQQKGLFDGAYTLSTLHDRLAALGSTDNSLGPTVLVTDRCRPVEKSERPIEPKQPRSVFNGEYGRVYSTGSKGIDKLMLQDDAINEEGISRFETSMSIAKGQQTRAELDPTWRRPGPALHSDGEDESESPAVAEVANNFYQWMKPIAPKLTSDCGPLTLVRLVRPVPKQPLARPTKRAPSTVEPCTASKTKSLVDDLLGRPPVKKIAKQVTGAPLAPSSAPRSNAFPGSSLGTIGRKGLSAFRR